MKNQRLWLQAQAFAEALAQQDVTTHFSCELQADPVGTAFVTVQELQARLPCFKTVLHGFCAAFAALQLVQA